MVNHLTYPRSQYEPTMTSTKLLPLTAVALLLLSVGCTPSGMLRDTPELSVDKIETPKPAKKKNAEESGTYMQQYAKGRALEASGRLDEARTLYGKMIAEQPARYEAHHRLAVVADLRRHHREAQEQYALALKASPENAEVHNDYAYSLFLDGQLGKAEAVAQKAVDLAPKNARYLNNLGLVYGHQGKINLALTTFRKCGSEADAQYNLAFILAARNDLDGAKKCFHKALAANPQFELARKALRNFEKADADPTILAEATDYDPRGVRLVPYIEPEDAGAAGKIQQVAASTPSSAKNNTRNLQQQARAMMQEKMGPDR